uniref:ANF_receptor domain-containing protein n=1 Tax=Panagrellus redivivus TaxID=6233 RepID=A0A7E4UP12_PANRE
MGPHAVLVITEIMNVVQARGWTVDVLYTSSLASFSPSHCNIIASLMPFFTDSELGRLCFVDYTNCTLIVITSCKDASTILPHLTCYGIPIVSLSVPFTYLTLLLPITYQTHMLIIIADGSMLWAVKTQCLPSICSRMTSERRRHGPISTSVVIVAIDSQWQCRQLLTVYNIANGTGIARLIRMPPWQQSVDLTIPIAVKHA